MVIGAFKVPLNAIQIKETMVPGIKQILAFFPVKVGSIIMNRSRYFPLNPPPLFQDGY